MYHKEQLVVKCKLEELHEPCENSLERSISKIAKLKWSEIGQYINVPFWSNYWRSRVLGLSSGY